MKNILLALSVSSTVLFSAPSIFNNNSNTNFLAPNEASKKIEVDNRVLAEINGKTFSVLDVVKKMDPIFEKHYAHMADSKLSRYQFYKANWKHFLNEMINTELMVSEAKNVRIEIPKIDVQKEVNLQYGPNLMANLEKQGLTYDEALKETERTMSLQQVFQRLLHFKGVLYQGMNVTPPSDIVKAYNQYIQEHKASDTWTYNFITFRGPNALETAQMSTNILNDLKGAQKDFKTLSLLFKDKVDEFDKKQISISQQFELEDDKIAPKHKDVLAKLSEKSFSEPQSEVSSSDNSTIYRIFFLDKRERGKEIGFADIENKLKEELTNQKINQELDSFITDLRKQYGVSDEDIAQKLPDNFEPFCFK